MSSWLIWSCGSVCAPARLPTYTTRVRFGMRGDDVLRHERVERDEVGAVR